MWLLYQLGILFLMALAALPLLLTRGRHYWRSFPQRLGLYRQERTEAAIWIHAVSVGEVNVAATLATRLPKDRSLLVTTVTPTGQERAQAQFPHSTVSYLPFDLGFAVRRFYDRFRPRLLVLSEGDLWPLVLRHAKKRHIPVIVINGRISDRSYSRLRSLERWIGPILAPVDRFGVQTQEDRSRLVTLGVDPEKIVVTGNLKYDTPAPPRSPELEAHLDRVAQGRPILVAGSTMRHEESQVLDAFAALGGGRSGLLILAPRHPERWESVAASLERRKLGFQRRSSWTGEQSPAGIEVLLLDSLGELASLYRQATAVFIGGSLVPTGGHNPLEAARFGVPIAIGPSTENFREIAQAFDLATAWKRVEDSKALSETWDHWLAHPDQASDVGRRGADLVAIHSGALNRTLKILEPWLGILSADE
jgi:3-deoxy-D-manno-octulosonic-acid transferase